MTAGKGLLKYIKIGAPIPIKVPKIQKLKIEAIITYFNVKISSDINLRKIKYPKSFKIRKIVMKTIHNTYTFRLSIKNTDITHAKEKEENNYSLLNLLNPPQQYK